MVNWIRENQCNHSCKSVKRVFPILTKMVVTMWVSWHVFCTSAVIVSHWYDSQLLTICRNMNGYIFWCRKQSGWLAYTCAISATTSNNLKEHANQKLTTCHCWRFRFWSTRSSFNKFACQSNGVLTKWKSVMWQDILNHSSLKKNPYGLSTNKKSCIRNLKDSFLRAFKVKNQKNKKSYINSHINFCG